MSTAPDWILVRAVIRAVNDPRWAGGVHRQHLAELVGAPPHGPDLRQAIGIAWRTGRADCCGQYVVKVPLPAASRPAARAGKDAAA